MNERELRRALDSLHAETLALQMILIALLSRMVATPNVGQIVVPSLDEAANRLEDFALLLGDRASPDHTVKALEIVERLRAAIVGDGKEPSR